MPNRRPTEAEIREALDRMLARARETPFGTIGGKVALPRFEELRAA